MADYKAIVTGGAKGIGYAISTALLEAGGKVCILDYSVSDGEKAQKSFEEKYGDGKAVFLKCDVSKKNEMHDAFHEAKIQMGGLNVVCNNAGVIAYEGQRNPIGFDEVIAINLGGAVNGCMLGLELMGTDSGGNGGVIINIASIAGIKAFPGPAIVYSATKAGVVHFTRCIAQTSVANHGVRVNCLCPEVVYTDIAKAWLDAAWAGAQGLDAPKEAMANVPKTDEEARERFLKPSDIGNEAIKLVTDGSTNGQVLLVTRNPEDFTMKVENVQFNN